MNTVLPIDAGRIGVAWPIPEGGIGVTARTDAAGEPYIGLYPLNPGGQPAGQPIEYPRSRLMINVVAGSDTSGEIVVFIDIEISPLGLDLWVAMPSCMTLRGYPRHLKALWGSPSPQLPDYPAKANWTVI